MIRLLSISALACVSWHALAQDIDIAPVYVSGSEGYHTFRIPALAVAADGTLLAFAEGRSSPNDHARNDIVLKRSTDHGDSWEALRVVAEDGHNSLNNPCVVVLRDSGRVVLMYQRYPKGKPERGVVPGYKGDVCRNFVMYSDDAGLSWSKPKDITKNSKRPTRVTSIAGGPGLGIELRRGEHAGRIIMPFNQGPWGEWRVYAVYSDNGGRSWKYGDVAPNPARGVGNEVQMVELSDGRVRLNARAHEGNKLRMTALSADGGETWSALEDVPELTEPQCNASIVRIADPLDDEKSRLLYTGPASQSGRVEGTAWLSYDEGATWSVRRLLVKGHFAYSTAARLANGQLACFYEGGEEDYIEGIRLARFSLAWLTDNNDTFESN